MADPSRVQNERLEAWKLRLGGMASCSNKDTSNCCYCGSNAANVDACELECGCSWMLAQSIWDHAAADEDSGVDTINRYFTEALESDPANDVLLAQFALFQWKERSDFGEAEILFERALSIDPTSEQTRTNILSLYSFFLSSTPPPSSRSLEDYRGSIIRKT